MIILGLDPAIRTTGYGVVEMLPGMKNRILDCGVIKNTAQMPHSECVRRLAGGTLTLWDILLPVLHTALLLGFLALLSICRRKEVRP